MPSVKPSLHIKTAKQERLFRLSTATGVIAALALDQRKSLRQLLARAAQVSADQIPDSNVTEFKNVVTRELTAYASAVLLDPEFGLQAVKHRASNCGLMFAYELDGYENPRPHRMLALMPHFSVRRLRELGAAGVKVLLHYAPRDHAAVNDEKCARIERIGSECRDLDMPFFLEPVVYDPGGLDPRSIEFAKQKPDLVTETVDLFSRDVYNVDVLKIEFPVIASYVESSSVYTGRRAYSMEEALEQFRRADIAAKVPYVFLSAGVSGPEFLESLRLAINAGSRFSGVLCGRATWQDGVAVYAKPGPSFDTSALEQWLRTSGTENIQAINHLLSNAFSWQRWLE